MRHTLTLEEFRAALGVPSGSDDSERTYLTVQLSPYLELKLDFRGDGSLISTGIDTTAAGNSVHASPDGKTAHITTCQWGEGLAASLRASAEADERRAAREAARTEEAA
jgi:hypothetical protein